jgi:hypothetical protein
MGMRSRREFRFRLHYPVTAYGVAGEPFGGFRSAFDATDDDALDEVALGEKEDK